MENILTSQIEVLKQRGLTSYLNKDLKNFELKFDQLQLLLDKPANDENFNKAFQLFYYIFDAVPLMFNILDQHHIFRALPNHINDLFTTQSRISYNKTNPELITPGKFNVWNEPMFYGCIAYQDKNNRALPASLTAALECCKDLNNKQKKILMQDITVGEWVLKNKLTVINFCFDEVHLSHNFQLKEANNLYLNAILSCYTSKAGEFIKNLLEYYSTLCRVGSDEGTYYLLTALFTAIRYYYKKEAQTTINGLLSSSAATEGKGLNIVIIPKAVDDYLILKSVVMERYFLVMPEADTYSCYPCSEMVVNHQNLDNFNFEFKKYSKPAERYLNIINSCR